MTRFLLLLCLLPAWLALPAASTLPDDLNRLTALADSLHQAGRSDSAAVVGERMVRLAEAQGQPSPMVAAYASMGVYLRTLGRLDEALQQYDKALRIATSPKFRTRPSQEDAENVATLYVNLAVLNLDMQHQEAAAKHARLAGEWAARCTDLATRSNLRGAAGTVLTSCGALQEAATLQSKAYADALQAKNAEMAFRAAAYTLLLSDRLGHADQVQAWRSRCQGLKPQVTSTMALLLYYQVETSLCLKHHDAAGALQWFGRILGTEGIDNLPFVKFDCYQNMHMAYAELGQYEQAYATLLKGNALRDSLWQQEKEQSLRDLTVKYETKEAELALARSEARRSEMLMWLFAAAGVLLLVVIAFVLYAARQRRRRLQREMEFAQLRAEVERQRTQQYVEGLENERQRMSRELHDGVCNDLLAIEMGMRQGRDADDTARLIGNCREAVRRISHELLPPEFAYASIDEVLRYHLSKQAEACPEGLLLTYESEAGGAAWTEVPDDVALEVYRITQEAVGNALKHAGATSIAVSMQLHEGALTLRVTDNGQPHAGQSRGVGMRTMRQRASAIGGAVSVTPVAGGGTCVLLQAPLKA